MPGYATVRSTPRSNSLPGKLAVIVLSVFALFGLTAFHPVKDANPKIRVGVFQNKPIVYYEEGPKGLFVEVLNHVAARENWELEYVPCNLGDCIGMLKEDNLDLMTSLGVSPEREEFLAFSQEPVWTFWGTVYAHDHSIQSVLELKHKRIGVRKNNKITTALQSMMSSFSVPAEYVEYDNYENAFQAFLAREIDAVAVNNTYGFDKRSEISRFRTPLVFYPFPAYFAASRTGKHASRLSVIDQYVRELREDDSSFFNQFQQKWYGPVDSYWTGSRVAVYMGALSVFAAIVLIIWRFVSIRKTNLLLRKSESRFRALVEGTKTIPWELDLATGQFTYMGHQALEIFGYPSESWTDLDVWAARLHPDDREKSLLFCRHETAKGADHDFEYRAVRADGAVVWIRDIVNVVMGPDGPERLTGFMHDITERKLSEIKEKYYRSRLESLWKISKLINEDMTTICNEILAEIINITESEYGFYGFMDASGEQMNIFSWSKSAMKECAIHDKQLVFPIAKSGVWGNAVRTGKPFLLNDYSEDCENKKGLPHGHVALTRVLSVPVLMAGKVVAVAAVANKRDKYITEDINNLETFLANVQIIINQKEYEEKLKINELLLNKSQQMARLGSWRLELENKTLTWSEEQYRIFGRTPETFAGTYEAFLEAVHPEDREMVAEKYNESIAASHSFECIHRIVLSDGSVKTVIEKSEPILDETGRAWYWFGFTQDITQQQEAARKLAWELNVNKQLAYLSSALVDPTKGIDYIAARVLSCARELTGSKHGYVSEIDKATGENVGHTLTEMMGHSCTVDEQHIAFLRGEDGKYPGLWGHVLNTGESFVAARPTEHPCFKGLPEGHVPLHGFLSVPVKYGDEIIGQIALANAVTEYTDDHLQAVQRIADLYALAVHRRQAEDAEKQLQNQLRQSRKMEAMGTLAGGIAHDFNNILSIIISANEMIQMDLPQEGPSQRFCQVSQKAANRAKELVKQILSFSRRSEQQELIAVKPDLMLKEDLKLISSVLPSSISIRTHIDSFEGFIEADPTQFHQLIMNLCTNASHAMKERGRLEISMNEVQLAENDIIHKPKMQPGRYCCLMVKDTGCGMDQETLENIFLPFFTTKNPGEGTGMGLAVAHGIVESHGGMINVVSAVDQGSTFYVYFPMVEKADIEEVKDGATISGGNERILFIDDEELLAEVGAAMLSRLGYHVTVKTDCIEALTLFKENQQDFDLIITDQTMPNMSGMEFAAEVMQVRPDLPIIICTGYSNQISGALARELGVELVYKPLDKDQLSQVIRNMFD